jgi:hypothetical protein
MAMEYFKSRQDERGSFAMAQEDLVAYYKPALAMTLAGRFNEASRTLNWIEHRFLSQEGDFVTEPGAKSHVPHFQKHFYHYIHGWLIQSFVLNGRFDLARKALAYLEPRQHSSGGFYSQAVPDPARPGDTLDVGSTCSCGFALLYAGQTAGAEKAAAFLIDALEKQRSAEAFYLRLTARGDLITVFDEADPDRMFFRLRPGDSFEVWALGYACAFLTKLHQATAVPEYLKAAKAYLDWTDVYRPKSVDTIPSVKVGWGASAYYAATGDAKAAETARHILDYLVESQLADGSWYFPDAYLRPAAQPFVITADLSGEMALRVCDIQRELIRGDQRRGIAPGARES